MNFPKFYINQGRRCGQTILKSVATGDAFSYEQLEKLTGRLPHQITTPVQIAYGLHKLGIDFQYPIKQGFFDEIEITRQRVLKEFGQEVLDRMNLPFIQKALLELKEKGKYYLEESFGLERVQPLIKEGNIPICLINFDVFVNREDKKSGHYLIVRELAGDQARIMDCGPWNASPDRKIYVRRLESSLMSTPWDWGWIFVHNN